METQVISNVIELPVKPTVLPVVTAENSHFQGDLGLAGIWQGFGRGFFAKKVSESDTDADAIPGLKMACKLADDLKKQENERKEFVKSFFMGEAVRAALAKFFLANPDRPRQDQLQAITVLARLARPGMEVNLRELESQIADKTPESITTTYLRHDLIPLMKTIGLIIQPKEGVNGWQWRDADKKASTKEIAQKLLKQAALMASPVHRELLDEQAKRYALLLQEKTLKQRLALEKANHQLIVQAQQKAEENENAMVALGMKKQVSNTPAWVASAAVVAIAFVLLLNQVDNNSKPPQSLSMANTNASTAVYEAAPDYHALSDEELLRQQYQAAGMDWDKLPLADRKKLMGELRQERMRKQP